MVPLTPDQLDHPVQDHPFCFFNARRYSLAVSLVTALGSPISIPFSSDLRPNCAVAVRVDIAMRHYFRACGYSVRQGNENTCVIATIGVFCSETQ